MAAVDAGKFITTMKATSTPEIAEIWGRIEDFYNKKLWHQLTLELNTLVRLPTMQEDTKLITLYNEFISDFESRLNPLTLVQLAMVVLERFEKAEEGQAFIERVGEKVKQHNEAFALTRILVGKIKLHKHDLRREAQNIIEEVDKILSEFDGVSPVHSHYYLLASDLYRIEGKHADFYRSSLRFLGCTDYEELTVVEQAKHAFFLSLAALLGEGVYNFGELLAHKILGSLKGTENEWLTDLLFAFNSGNVAKFRQLKPKWATQADLAANETLLFEKVCLLCLMEMSFRREATQRIISFNEIAQETTLPVEQVELLTMKALSQALVKGKIDQVNSTVHITWVQPRVLDKDQVKIMLSKIDSWSASVTKMEKQIEINAGEILTY
jgi:26S proteasome regulatory subunit N9